MDKTYVTLNQNYLSCVKVEYGEIGYVEQYIRAQDTRVEIHAICVFNDHIEAIPIMYLKSVVRPDEEVEEIPDPAYMLGYHDNVAGLTLPEAFKWFRDDRCKMVEVVKDILIGFGFVGNHADSMANKVCEISADLAAFEAGINHPPDEKTRDLLQIAANGYNDFVRSYSKYKEAEEANGRNQTSKSESP